MCNSDWNREQGVGERTQRGWEQERDDLRAKLAESEQRVKRLEGALQEALGVVVESEGYIGAYFWEKDGFGARIARLRQALAGKKGAKK